MKAIAFTYVRDERDILPWTVRHMLDQGLDVWVIDNWSTDGTWEWLIEETARWQGRLYVERFPERPAEWFDLRSINGHIELLSRQLGTLYDWRVIFGADEVLTSPWPGIGLLQGLEIAGETSNVVDFEMAMFHPVDDGWTPEVDPVAYFTHWERGRLDNERAWRGPGVQLLDGGHHVALPSPPAPLPTSGRGESKKLFGVRFVIRHYSFRTQAQATRKIAERRARYAPAEKAMGWHTHYDGIEAGHCFIRDPHTLRCDEP